MLETDQYKSQAIVTETGLKERYQPKIFSTQGRIGRLRFFVYVVTSNILLFINLILAAAFLVKFEKSEGGTLGMYLIWLDFLVFYLVNLAFFLIFLKRRLNDLNKTSWLCLLSFVPIANIIMGIYSTFFKGTDGSNQYGAAPVKNSSGVKMMGVVCLVCSILIAAIFTTFLFMEIKNTMKEELESKAVSL